MPSRVTIELFSNPRLAAVQAGEKSIEGLVIALVGLGKKLCPVRDGPLRNTVMGITATQEFGFNESPGDKAPADQKLDIDVKEGHGAFGTASDHWYPEFGTRRMMAQPFIRPSVEFLVRGGSAAAIVAKFNAEEMARQFKAGKRQFLQYKSGEVVAPGDYAG